MSDPLSVEIASRVIGVIDLQGGRAVHAIAGERNHYRPVGFCGGNPLALADHYRELGIAAFYVADLDGIGGGEMQLAMIDAISRSVPDCEVLVDVGWTGLEKDAVRIAVGDLAHANSRTTWIAATESCRSVDAMAGLAELVSPSRTRLGLDYRDGHSLAGSGDEGEWIDSAIELGCCGVVVLDLAAVGTSQGPATGAICQRIKRHAPSLAIDSGGGVRSVEDIRMLMRAGCDRCLVATALYP